MVYLLFLISLITLVNGVSIVGRNSTVFMHTTVTSNVPSETTTSATSTTPMTTTAPSTLPTTTLTYIEETTSTAEMSGKPYFFQSNFSRNHDSVSVALHSNRSEAFVSINNTFTGVSNGRHACEILFSEHSSSWKETVASKIIINFNGSLTRELAMQLSDRLLDFVDLLPTVRSVANPSVTVDTV